jgi:hypothetical protein
LAETVAERRPFDLAAEPPVVAAKPQRGLLRDGVTAAGGDSAGGTSADRRALGALDRKRLRRVPEVRRQGERPARDHLGELVRRRVAGLGAGRRGRLLSGIAAATSGRQEADERCDDG